MELIRIWDRHFFFTDRCILECIITNESYKLFPIHNSFFLIPIIFCSIRFISETQNVPPVLEMRLCSFSDPWQMVQFSEKLQSTAAERDELSSERTRHEEEMERLRSVTVERDQILETLQMLTEERDQLKRDQQLQDQMVRHFTLVLLSVILNVRLNATLHVWQLVELREQLQSASAERDHLLSEKTKSDLERTTLEEIETCLASITEEKEQLMEILQSNREEKNLLRKDLEDKDELVSFMQVFGLVSLKQFGADVSASSPSDAGASVHLCRERAAAIWEDQSTSRENIWGQSSQRERLCSYRRERKASPGAAGGSRGERPAKERTAGKERDRKWSLCSFRWWILNYDLSVSELCFFTSFRCWSWDSSWCPRVLRETSF